MVKSEAKPTEEREKIEPCVFSPVTFVGYGGTNLLTEVVVGSKFNEFQQAANPMKGSVINSNELLSVSIVTKNIILT